MTRLSEGASYLGGVGRLSVHRLGGQKLLRRRHSFVHDCLASYSTLLLLLAAGADVLDVGHCDRIGSEDPRRRQERLRRVLADDDFLLNTAIALLLGQSRVLACSVGLLLGVELYRNLLKVARRS